MWEKRIDHYMGEVYFTNKINKLVRELCFTHNTCIDSIYDTVQDYKDGKKKRENWIRLTQDYGNLVSAKNDFDKAYKLEALLSSADFNFQIPDEFLKK